MKNLQTGTITGIEIPDAINKRLADLNRLATEYPNVLPPDVCANFLHLSLDSLHTAILCGCIPGALCWRKLGNHNHGYRIETLPFYQWQTAQLRAVTYGKEAV